MGSHFQAPPSTVHIRSIFPHWKVGKPEQLFPYPIMLQLCMFNFFFLLLMLCFTIHHSIAVKLEHGIILMYSALGLMNVNWHVSSPLAISFYPRLHASKCKSLYVYIDMYLNVYIQTHMVYAANQSFCMLASFFLWFFMGARRLPPTRTYLYKLRQRKKCNSFEWFRLHYANTSTVGGEYLFAHYKYIEFLAF